MVVVHVFNSRTWEVGRQISEMEASLITKWVPEHPGPHKEALSQETNKKIKTKIKMKKELPSQ